MATQRIAMVLNDYYPSDIRVAKEAYSLIKSGFEVHLLCMRRKNEVSYEEIERLKIHRVYVATSVVGRGLWDILLTFNFKHPVFIKKLKQLLNKFSFSALHIHDLPLCKSGILVGKEAGIPVVCDFHENYPEGLKIWYKWKSNPLIRLKNSIFFGFKRWKRYERWVSQNASHIIAVVEEMKDKLVSDFSIPENKITVVTNSESIDFKHQDHNENILSDYNDHFIILYTGNVGPHRGVDTAIAALAELRDLPTKLIVAGTVKPNVLKRLVRLVNGYNVAGIVDFLGYQSFKNYYSLMSAADVNLIPHNLNGHTDNTVPHKLYQAMMVSKPLLVSSCKPLQRIVEETNSGLVFEADNPVDLAQQVRILYADEGLRIKLGKNAYHHSVNGNYNWEYTSRTLVECYKRIIS